MLSQSAIHAIRAMVALATQGPDDYCGVSSIAKITGSPRNYLGKLLLQLSRHNLVESRKGLGGGFRLAKRPDAICLHDVIAAIEDTTRWTECALSGRECSSLDPCMVHFRWQHARDAFLAFVRETSIAELAISHPQTDERATGLVKQIRTAVPRG